jgi:hypothetical protein
MSAPIPRAEFTATLDDAVDASMRWAPGSKTGRPNQRREAWMWGLMFAGVLMILTVWKRENRSPGIIWTSTVFAIVGLALFVWFWPKHANSAARKRLRPLCSKLLNGRESFRVEVELRPTGVWTRQTDVETLTARSEALTAWSELVQVADASDGIELRFHANFIVVRNRGFATPADRDAFLVEARARSSRA